MSFARYFKISSYCLISAGFLAIAATGIIDILSIGLFASALLLSCFVDTEVIGKRIPAWALSSLFLLFLAFSFADFSHISRSFVVSAVHFLFFASAVILLTLSRDRDYFFLYLISFAEFLTAATLTIDIAFGILFLFFLLSMVSTLILFEMRRSSARALIEGPVHPLVTSRGLKGTGMELFSRFPAGLMLATTLGVSCLILILAIPLFVLLPRVSMGALNQPRGRARLVSGFSDRVELGRGGIVRESDAIVMRVRVSKPPEKLPSSLKWRGLALEQFDGKTWRRGNGARQSVLTQARYYKLEELAQSTDLLYQTFFLEALTTDVVFASHKVLAVSDDLEILQRDSSGNLFASMHPLRKLRYAAISDRTQPVIDNIPENPNIPEEIQQSCLQLPALDPRIERLTQKVTQDAQNPYAKALALEAYLRNSYAYSLELPTVSQEKDSIALFLFESRQGHCEYFASALAVMLRQLGIPARLVNGFRAGEYNSIGKAFVVRQYNAHSWVEAYFSPNGWLELDPTPLQARRAKSAFARLLSDTLGALDLWWWEGIVNFDLGKQYNLIQGLRSGIANSYKRVELILNHLNSEGKRAINTFDFRKFASKMPGIFSLFILLAFLTLGFLSWRRPAWFRRLKHQLRRTVHRRDQNSTAVSFYIEALDVLHSYGFSKKPSQTPLEFAESLQGNPAGEPLRALTHLYNRIRFGCPQLLASNAEARNLMRDLNNALHLSKRTGINTDLHG